VEEKMELEFGGKSVRPDVRRLFDMREVIYDKSWLAAAEDFDPASITKEEYNSTKSDIQILIQELNTIIRTSKL